MTKLLTKLTGRPAPARPVLVDVTNRWTVSYRPDGTPVHRRDVIVRTPAGELVTRPVRDDHPALVRFLGAVAA